PGASKHCKECGNWFSGLLGFRRMEYCSDGCRDISQSRYRRVAKSKDKAVRRARERFNGPYVAIDPIVVFERDGWACRYCGCDTPRALRGTYDGNAPELDHRVPLSRGGSHTYDNAATSCRDCNILKSSMTEYEFDEWNQEVAGGRKNPISGSVYD